MKNRILSLEERLEEAQRDKEKLKVELNYEIERLTKTHQETINLLREDNRELEKRYFEELSDKRREDELILEKEREYMNEINVLRREVAQFTDENNRFKPNRMSSSAKKELKKKKHSARSSKGFTSDNEEENSLMGSRHTDRMKLFEIDLQGKNMKIMELKGINMILSMHNET